MTTKDVFMKETIKKIKEIRAELVKDQLQYRKENKPKNTIVGYKIHYLNAVLELLYGTSTNDGCVTIGSLKYRRRVMLETIPNVDLGKFINRIDRTLLRPAISLGIYKTFKSRGYE